MRRNGTIQVETRTDAGVNEYGEAIASETQLSDPAPCLITTNSDTRLGKYEDGEFRQASFTILLELDDPDFDCERVKLTRFGKELGSYRVQSVEFLPSVGRVQIIV